MVIDHIDYTFFDRGEIWMFIVGRATFPLFCYAIAANMYRSGHDLGRVLKSYGLILMAMAIVTEPISQLTRDIDVANVLFTLAFGGVIAALSLRLKDLYLVIAFCVFAALSFFPTFSEFGWSGMALPAVLLAIMRQKNWAWIFAAFFLLMLNTGVILSDASFNWHDVAPIMPFIFITFFGVTFLPATFIYAAKTYTQTGRLLHKYALHLFYPGHLLILWIIKTFITA